jgi:hypothetical protein
MAPIALDTPTTVAYGVSDPSLAMAPTLERCWRLLARTDTLAMQLSELGDIELPPDTRSAADAAFIQSAVPLYLASELEAARLIPAVEMLASISISGGLRGDIGAASPLLYRFWQRRNERFTASERRAFFARLFGAETDAPLAVESGSNTTFATLMIDITEAIYKLEPLLPYGNAATLVALRLAATRLAANLGPRGGGMAGFASRDLLRSIQEAIDILKHAPLQRALGAHDVWSAVGAIARLYLHEEVDVASHVRRAKAGTVILSWLADVLPRLDDNHTPLISAGDEVLGAAVTWLQASLTLEESRSQQSPSHPSRAMQ